VRAGDGFAGVPDKAPYDRIIITAAAETIPEALVAQLADGGVMLLPLGPHAGPQHIVKLTKSGGETKQEELIAVRFVPLLPGQAHELCNSNGWKRVCCPGHTVGDSVCTLFW